MQLGPKWLWLGRVRECGVVWSEGMGIDRYIMMAGIDDEAQDSSKTAR